MGFQRVKRILDDLITEWGRSRGADIVANVSGHGPTFSWATKAALLAAEGHGKRLIQPEMIGNGQGAKTNLVIDLRTGLTVPQSRMPEGGPFASDARIKEIEDWIDAGCPD